MFESLLYKNITICGGAGFCGHHLALALAKHGVNVSVVDGFVVNNLARWVAETSPFREPYMRILADRVMQMRAACIPLYSVDLRNYHATSNVLAKIQPDTIVHLAAVSHSGKSNKDRHDCFDHSINSLKNTLDYAIGAQVKHYVWQSSSMVYGHIRGRASEDDVLNPIGWYGGLKVAGERMVWAAHQVDGLPFTITRPSALYGPGCVSRRVVQIFLENALAGEPLKIAADGTERLDFTYIDDWIEGMLLILSKPEALNQVFNLARGDARSLNDLAEVIRRHFPNLRVEYEPRDALMPLRDTLSTQKISELLGYHSYIGLEEGVRRYLAWYRSRA